MSASTSSNILRRQVIVDDGDPGWWYSDEAYIVKWIIIGVIFVLFLIFVVGGYFHAQRRMKKGLQPLQYHRWLISRRQKERWFPQPVNSYGYYRQGQWSQQPHGQSYPMQSWGPAPPAYQEPEHVPPYAPPQGSSKVNPDQTYTAPPGAPPPTAYGNTETRRTAGANLREVDNNTGSGSRENAGPYSPTAGPSQTYNRPAGYGDISNQSTAPKY